MIVRQFDVLGIRSASRRLRPVDDGALLEKPRRPDASYSGRCVARQRVLLPAPQIGLIDQSNQGHFLRNWVAIEKGMEK